MEGRAEINLAVLDQLIEKVEKLKSILQETPQINEFINLMQKGIPDNFVIPQQADQLLSMNKVAKLLGVNSGRIYQYVAQGRLPFVYTPPTSGKKFRTSDVNKFIESLSAEKDDTKKIAHQAAS
jgi:excisionase family DNA binding protein